MTVDVGVVEDVWGEPFDSLAADLRVGCDPEGWSRRDVLGQFGKDVRALVVRNRTRVDRALLETCPRIQVVARAGVGLDNIDVSAADELGVVVVAPFGANAVSVAEHALCLALSLAKHVVPLDADCRQGRWNRLAGRELSGGTWALLGAGATGRACARLARGLGMDVVAYDPYVDPAESGLVDAGVRLLSLKEAVAGADVVSCHLPATPQTRGLVNASLLACMRPTAIFLSLGRGEVVEEKDLVTALESGQIAGAGLDVRADEPPVPGRLEKLENVVLTPHTAGITEQSQQRILTALAEDIRAVLSGAPARHAVGAVRQVRTT